MNMVINSFHALGRTLQTIMPDAPFPKLGIKIVEKNERHFSEQQLREAANAVSVMSLGSSKLAQKAAGDVLAGRAALTDVLGEPTKGVQEHHAAPAPKPAAATPAKPAAAAAAADALPAGWVSAWTDEGCACAAARAAAGSAVSPRRAAPLPAHLSRRPLRPQTSTSKTPWTALPAGSARPRRPRARARARRCPPAGSARGRTRAVRALLRAARRGRSTARRGARHHSSRAATPLLLQTSTLKTRSMAARAGSARPPVPVAACRRGGPRRKRPTGILTISTPTARRAGSGPPDFLRPDWVCTVSYPHVYNEVPSLHPLHSNSFDTNPLSRLNPPPPFLLLRAPLNFFSPACGRRLRHLPLSQPLHNPPLARASVTTRRCHDATGGCPPAPQPAARRRRRCRRGASVDHHITQNVAFVIADSHYFPCAAGRGILRHTGSASFTWAARGLHPSVLIDAARRFCAMALHTSPSRLLGACINLAALREDAWRELTTIFDSVRVPV